MSLYFKKCFFYPQVILKINFKIHLLTLEITGQAHHAIPGIASVSPSITSASLCITQHHLCITQYPLCITPYHPYRFFKKQEQSQNRAVEIVH